VTFFPKDSLANDCFLIDIFLDCKKFLSLTLCQAHDPRIRNLQPPFLGRTSILASVIEFGRHWKALFKLRFLPPSWSFLLTDSFLWIYEAFWFSYLFWLKYKHFCKK
jgi:hypothetical protein